MPVLCLVYVKAYTTQVTRVRLHVCAHVRIMACTSVLIRIPPDSESDALTHKEANL